MFGRPKYQDAAVQNYLNTANPPTSMFNSTGRGCTFKLLIKQYVVFVLQRCTPLTVCAVTKLLHRQ